MKNTKTSSIILAIFTIATLTLEVITDNAEAMGISLAMVSKISTLVTIIKLVYDNRDLFNAQDVADYKNDNAGVYAKLNDNSIHTAEDVENWRANHR